MHTMAWAFPHLNQHTNTNLKNIYFFRLVHIPALSVLNPRRTQQTTPIRTNLEELFRSTMTLYERVAHVPRRHPDFRRSPSLKGMPSRQMPSQMHQARLCRDRWDTVCYNWQQSPRASSENLTLAKHILHSSDAHPGDTKWGRGLGGGRRQRRKSWSRMPGAAPKDTMLQKLPHPHRQTKPTKPSLQAAAEDPIKSSSISNLPHHGKIQTTPSNPESLKVLFLYSFPTPTP